MVIEPDNVQNEIYDLVTAERRRQDAKWGEQNHPFTRIDERLSIDTGELSESVIGVREYVDAAANDARLTWLAVALEELLETAEAYMGTLYLEGMPAAERAVRHEAFEKELVQTIAVLVQAFESHRRQRAFLESYLGFLGGKST